jgi:2Fe-2S ferredoxin
VYLVTQPEIHFQPDNVKIRVRKGMSLLDAARSAKVGIRTRCDGKAACLMCKVNVADQEGLEPLTRNEVNKLGSLKYEGVRLSCQARVNGQADVTVQVPEDPLKAAVRRQLLMLKEQEDGI